MQVCVEQYFSLLVPVKGFDKRPQVDLEVVLPLQQINQTLAVTTRRFLHFTSVRPPDFGGAGALTPNSSSSDGKICATSHLHIGKRYSNLKLIPP